jgi:hypothetical protein
MATGREEDEQNGLHRDRLAAGPHYGRPRRLSGLTQPGGGAPHACANPGVRFLHEGALYFQDIGGAPAGFSLLRRARSIQLQYVPAARAAGNTSNAKAPGHFIRAKPKQKKRDTERRRIEIRIARGSHAAMPYLMARSPEDRFPEEFGPASARRRLDGHRPRASALPQAPLAGNTKVRAICMGFASH